MNSRRRMPNPPGDVTRTVQTAREIEDRFGSRLCENSACWEMARTVFQDWLKLNELTKAQARECDAEERLFYQLLASASFYTAWVIRRHRWPPAGRPLYPRKPTCVRAVGRSAKGHGPTRQGKAEATFKRLHGWSAAVQSFQLGVGAFASGRRATKISDGSGHFITAHYAKLG